MGLRKRCAAGDAQNLSADVARLLGGEEDVRRCQLGRLGRTSDGGLRGAELRDLLGGHGGRDQWRPHRPWCHRVDPDALGYQVLGKPLREGDDGALGGGVVQEPRLWLVGFDRGGVDDARAGSHVRYRRLGEPEHRVEVGFQDAVELLGGDVGYAARLHHLVGGVVNEDVYPLELVHGLLHDVLAVGLVPDVAGYPNRLPAGLLDHARRLLGVRLFLFEVGDQDVHALAREGERDGPSDTRVAARYDGLLTLEPAGAAVGLVAVVGLWLHLRLEARVLQLLFAEVGLRVLRRRILLGVLVGHGSSFVSGGSRARPRIAHGHRLLQHNVSYTCVPSGLPSPPRGLSDSLGPADRPYVVAEELFRLGGDVFANPFVRHLWGAFFVQAFLQYVHQPPFVGGRKLPVARGALDAIGSGMMPLSCLPYHPAGSVIKRVHSGSSAPIKKSCPGYPRVSSEIPRSTTHPPEEELVEGRHESIWALDVGQVAA